MYLQQTGRNAVVTYKTISDEIIGTATTIQGWADDNFLQIDLPNNVEVKKSLDNITFGWVKSVVMTGRLMLLAGSIGQQTFQQVQQFQTNTGIIAPGTLTIAYPSLGQVITYNNFTITSPFSGFGIGERIANSEITFSADLPDSAAVNALVQLGLAAIGAFAA